jgi:hypothetical protein
MAMKPRSVLGTFAVSTVCTSAGIVVGMWMEANSRPPNIDAPCADAPLSCAKRAAESKCGGAGKYRLVGKEVVDGQRERFTFVCVTGETI